MDASGNGAEPAYSKGELLVSEAGRWSCTANVQIVSKAVGMSLEVTGDHAGRCSLRWCGGLVMVVAGTPSPVELLACLYTKPSTPVRRRCVAASVVVQSFWKSNGSWAKRLVERETSITEPGRQQRVGVDSAVKRGGVTDLQVQTRTINDHR